MPPDRGAPDDPREWLRRARSDLALAAARSEHVYLEDLCFHAQQCAEKAIKSLLMAERIQFPFIHDVGRLLSILEEHAHRVPEEVWEADQLTRFAVVTRYPGMVESVSESLYLDTLRIAEGVLRWATQHLDQMC